MGTLTNATDTPMSWAAHPTRKSESLFSIPIIQMGARVYLPTIGRFLQVDPIEGGTTNDYAYVLDPINDNDYSGQFGWKKFFKKVAKVAACIVAVVGVVTAAVLAAPYIAAAGAATIATASAGIAGAVRAVTAVAPKIATATRAVTGTTSAATKATKVTSNPGFGGLVKGEKGQQIAFKTSGHASERMLGSRGDVGVTNWSARTTIQYGAQTPSHSNRIVHQIDGFARVVIEEGAVITAIPLSRTAGPEFQGWFVQTLISTLK